MNNRARPLEICLPGHILRFGTYSGGPQQIFPVVITAVLSRNALLTGPHPPFGAGTTAPHGKGLGNSLNIPIYDPRNQGLA